MIFQDESKALGFSFFTLNGKDLELLEFKGKVILIVNTASNCGFTKQYADLQALYDQYKDAGFTIIAVPSNDFGGQEPNDNEHIIQFCESRYHITFPIVNKTQVTGNDAHPFYIYAKDKLGFLTGPKWNFHKYLIDREGELVRYFYSYTQPNSRRLIKAIESLL